MLEFAEKKGESSEGFCMKDAYGRCPCYMDSRALR